MSGYVGSKRSSSLVSATEITLDGAKLKSSGDSITKSDGTTAVLSESGGVVTLNNGTLGANVSFANIADDAISGDKIHSGTISSSTLDGIKLKSSGNSITKSDGTTTVLSESGGVVTLNNGTIGSGVDFSGIANDSISGDKIDGGTATPATLSGSILNSTKLVSSGTSIYKSNGSTAVISESGGTATLNNVSLGSSVNFGSISNDSISGDKIHGGTISGSTLDGGVVFPAGHMLRQFYDEHYFNGSPVSITTTASNWSGLEIAITNPSTSNYLFLQMFIPDVYADGSNRGLYGGFVYSTNSFSTQTTLGTKSFYHAQHVFMSSYGLANSALLLRVPHPTSSNYSIRPYFKAFGNTIKIGQGNNGSDSVATLFAMEIKG